MLDKKKIGSWLLLAIIIFLGLWQWFNPYPKQIELTQQENKVVDKLLVDPIPRCFGRFLIDLPDGFSFQTGAVFINKQKVEVQRMYLPAFEQRIRLREDELRKTKPISAEDAPLLKNIYILPNGMKGIVFERTSSPVAPDAFRNLEAHIYNNGVAFKTIVETVNPDSKRYQKDREIEPELYRNNVKDKLNELNGFLSRLHGRKETSVPEGKGFCIPDGFISGVSQGDEEVTLSYRSTKNPRLYITLSSDNFLQEKTSMLERSSSISADLTNAGGRTLGKGERKINQLATEEWLMVGIGKDASSGHVFTLNVNEKTGSSATPYVRIELNHGPLPDDTLSENEVIVLWQKITETLRLRPGAF